MQKKPGRLIAIAVLVIFAVASIEYFYYRQALYPATDDAYVKANYVKVASLVNGKVEKVFVEENGFVKKGDTIFTLNKSEYEFAATALKHMKYQLTHPHCVRNYKHRKQAHKILSEHSPLPMSPR